jgi:monomeric sarcosine oxidase
MDAFPRRAFLKGSMLLTAASMASAEPQSVSRMHVVVVGAGAFGGWTALHLLRKGARVTLLDAWGPGNSRASSGGETRVIRAVYGPNHTYVKWTKRSLQLWRENENAWGRQYLFPTGVLWLVHENDEYETPALPLLEQEGLAHEKLTATEAAKRYPQTNFDGIRWALLEKDAGYLLARQACLAVMRAFVKEGGEYRTASAQRGPVASGRMEAVVTQDGSSIKADHFVFCCGPWLGKIFPEFHTNWIQPTRQEVFFFGLPAGNTSFSDSEMPVWIDHGSRLIYGIPGNEYRGFKIADDTHGSAFDPTGGERVVAPESVEAMRRFIAMRFPGMKDAPLVETRVCQYENSPDGHFIIDRHPETSNIWIAGGGSGHGYKHGPALGEYVASLVYDGASRDPFFQLSRFDQKKES